MLASLMIKEFSLPSMHKFLLYKLLVVFASVTTDLLDIVSKKDLHIQ